LSQLKFEMFNPLNAILHLVVANLIALENSHFTSHALYSLCPIEMHQIVSALLVFIQGWRSHRSWGVMTPTFRGKGGGGQS